MAGLPKTTMYTALVAALLALTQALLVVLSITHNPASAELMDTQRTLLAVFVVLVTGRAIKNDRNGNNGA